MKRHRIVILLVILAAMLFSLTACTIQEDSEELRAMTDQMIQGLINDDFETCYDLVRSYATQEEFADAYQQMRYALADAEGYTLKQMNWRKHTSGGVTEVAVQYLLTFGEERYSLQVANSSEKEGLMTFSLSQLPSEEESEMKLLGEPGQTVFLVIALVETAFMVWMLVDCAKRKIKQKWLWIVLILAGVVMTVTKTGDNLQLNLSFGLFFSFTAKYMNAAGDSVTRILLPVGALVYLFYRKRLLTPPIAPQTATEQTVRMEEQPAEPSQVTMEEESADTQAEANGKPETVPEDTATD